MSDESQIHIPPSFDALYRDARHRLTLDKQAFRVRYELCEDMAQLLVARCQALQQDLGVDEAQVLQRTEAGLATPESGFSAAEAGWVVTRLAELLDWPWHARPVADAAPDRRN